MKRGKKTLVALCRNLIAIIFWLTVRLHYSLLVRGIENDRGFPCTYLGMTHKRDIDPFVLVPGIIFHRGRKALAPDVRFALRGDGFTRGFLARMLDRPAWLARLLHPLSIGAALRWLGTYPIEGLLRPAEEWLREAMKLEGNARADTLLSPAFLQILAQSTQISVEEIGSWPLARLLAWRYHAILQKFYGPEILREEKRRPLERRVIRRIRANLDEIIACLQQGGSFFGSPEAQLSPDGKLSALNAGFFRIVRAAPPDLRIIPISLIYDFMTIRRQRIFVNFAPALETASRISQDELSACLRQAWLQGAYFTCSQLGSAFLIEHQRAGQLRFTDRELAESVYQRASSLRDAGRQVDPRLLDRSGVTRRVRDYLAYVERRGLVHRSGKSDDWSITFANLTLQVGLREVAYNDMPLLYAYNEFQDLLSL